MSSKFSDTIPVVRRIFVAVLLRDLRTRFGRSYISYLVAILWPLSHMLTILLSYVLVHRVAPIGDDPTLFAATGLLPYILCLYPARMITVAVNQNKPLLQFPIIKPNMLIFARATLEILNALIVTATMYAGFYVFGIKFEPNDLFDLFAGICCSIYLGVCIGFLNVVFYSVLGVPALIIMILILVGFYLTSGVFLPVAMFPKEAQEWDAYNPLFQSVEWLRTAYYGTDSPHLDRFYIFFLSTVLLAMGMVGERLIRGRVIT